MSRFLPFLPVFAGGQTLFQPVYVDDLARAIEIISRDEKAVRHLVSGKIVEAGGPKGERLFLQGRTFELIGPSHQCTHTKS